MPHVGTAPPFASERQLAIGTRRDELLLFGNELSGARPSRDRWFIDETYIRVGGRWTYLYRAADQHGQVIDVMLNTRRDPAAARRFFAGAVAVGTRPVE